MNGYRFYADLDETFPQRTTRKQLELAATAGKQCNVIALFVGDEYRRGAMHEGLVATFAHLNSDTSVGMVDRGYLRKCRRIGEPLARKLHPRLFARLDANTQ
jgi:hypothetical protein